MVCNVSVRLHLFMRTYLYTPAYMYVNSYAHLHARIMAVVLCEVSLNHMWCGYDDESPMQTPHLNYLNEDNKLEGVFPGGC